MPDVDVQIRSAIDAFIADLSDLVRAAAVDAVSDALGGPSGRRGRRPGRPAGTSPGRRRKGEKRSPEAIQKLQGELLSAIKANPGSRMEQLGKVVGASTKDLMLVTRKLLASKAVRKRGVKRATTYYPAK